MDLRRLDAFCKVYELKSFSKAGQSLFLSQPTISAHIAALEEELGINLFDRIGRGIMATMAGDILYRHAREIFLAVEKAEAEIHLILDKIAGDLPIGGSTIPANYLLPVLLAEFTRKYPNVKINLSVGDSAVIVDKVLSGELMVGVVGAREEHRDLTYLPILQDELVVVAPPALAEKMPVVSVSDLLALPWVMREKGSGTRKAMEQGFAELDIDSRKLQVVIQVHSTGAVLRSVQAGIGVSVTSRLAASPEIDRGDLVVLNVPGLGLERCFYAVYHEHRKIFPASQRFIEFLSTKYTGAEQSPCRM
ncbi:MAG: selenium metabolism-associated LysR family transcriptional regulator [Desulfovibrionales bacterium]